MSRIARALVARRQARWSAAWIACGAAAVYALAALAADPTRRAIAAWPLAFEVGCWAAALVLLARRDPSGYPRVSNLGVLTMLWGALYLIYPSLVWFTGGYIPFAVALTPEMAAFVFTLHGLFLLAFIGGYVGLQKPERGPPLDTRPLPSGMPLFLVPFVFLAVNAAANLAEGRAVLPSMDYGEWWLREQAHMGDSARMAGELSYLWSQLQYKLNDHMTVAQGIGAGLMIVRAFQTRRRRVMTGALLIAGELVLLLFSPGVRHQSLAVVIVAVVLADMLAGPLPWKKLFLVVLLGLTIFEFFGYLRDVRHFGLSRAIWDSCEALGAALGQGVLLQEFTGMLGKEALTIQLFQSAGFEGLMFLPRSVLSLIPGQLFPWKFGWQPTNMILSEAVYGKVSAALGYGVAGTMIGEGYRFAGVFGIVALAAGLGAGCAMAERWLWREAHRGLRGPVLLKAALIAGFGAWTFKLLRQDVCGVLGLAVYNVIIPWFVLSRFLLNRQRSVWLRPLPLHHVAAYRHRPRRPAGGRLQRSTDDAVALSARIQRSSG